MVGGCFLLGRLKLGSRRCDLLMELANVDEAILLFVLDQIEFESMGLLLDVIVRLLQLRIQLLVLICAILLLFKDLTVIFILVGHLLSFLLQLQKLCIFFFDVAF